VLDISGSSFFIVEEEHQRLKGYLGQPPEHWPNIEKIVISLNEPVYCAEVINTKQPRVVPEAEKDPKMVAWLVRYYNCKAALIWPVVKKRKTKRSQKQAFLSFWAYLKLYQNVPMPKKSSSRPSVFSP